MSNSKLQEAIKNPLGKARKSSGILIKLFWMVIHEYGINHLHWKRSLRNYVNDPFNVPEQTTTKRTESRSNLISAITADDTTWLQLIRGLKAMDIRKLKIEITTFRGDDMVEKKVSLDYTLTNRAPGSGGSKDDEAN